MKSGEFTSDCKAEQPVRERADPEPLSPFSTGFSSAKANALTAIVEKLLATGKDSAAGTLTVSEEKGIDAATKRRQGFHVSKSALLTGPVLASGLQPIPQGNVLRGNRLSLGIDLVGVSDVVRESAGLRSDRNLSGNRNRLDWCATDAHGGVSVASEKPDVLITSAARIRRRITGPSSRGCIVVYAPE